MRATPLMLAITLALGLPANEIVQAASIDRGPAAAQTKRTFILTFDEQPVALFEGFRGGDGRPALAATSPSVTGARTLDANSRAALEYRKYLGDLRGMRLNEASARVGRTLKPSFVYELTLNGVALELTDAEALAIAGMPGVKRIREEFIRYPMTDRGPAWIKANTLWDGTANGGVARKGEGIIVGVIDTGIAQAHPSFAATAPVDGYVHTNPKGTFLGKCGAGVPLNERATCNNKLIGIHDFTSGGGETDNGADNATGSGHGTHTASTAAGNAYGFTTSTFGPSYTGQISGVAPRANIISYKACEKTAACRGSWTLAAIEQAVADQVNVINYSIGGSPIDPFESIGTGGSSDDDTEAFLAARAAGIVVAAAAGNDGPAPGTHGNPANAPWVLGVAANAHDRAVANNLSGLSASGAGAAPGGGSGLYGAGNSVGTSSLASAPIVVADPIQCAEGSNPDNDPPTGVSKPAAWGPTTYAGKIVVCMRGFYARVAKAKNVDDAGAVGMILVNQLEEGDSIVPTNYDLPSVHLTYTDGQALLAWLGSGSGHVGQLGGVQIQNIASYGDRLGDFSGRGPVIPFGVVKPDLTAPGVEILAAAPATSGVKTLTGTSMASPHVAGAAALLKSAKGSWTPSQIQSALMLTSRPVNIENGATVTPHDQGSGTVDLQQAVQAGLYLNVTDAQFKAADASNAHTLNLPSLGSDQCFQTCGLTRTFTDMAGGGTYSIESTLPAGVTMTPSVSSFSVGSGASQAVTFTFDVSTGAQLGQWVYGEVRLVKTAGNGASTLRLPVAIYSSPFVPGTAPSDISHTTSTERGFFDATLGNIAPLADARFIATELVAPDTVTVDIAEDATEDDPYDSAAGTYRDSFVIPASPVSGAVTYRIRATTSAAQDDIDLYVGLDADGDSAPDEAEQLCVSASASSDETCEFSVATTSTAQTFWVMAQNWQGTGEDVTVESVAIPMVAAANKTLTATGPGITPSATDFKVRFTYDDPSMLSGQRRLGYLLVQGTPGNTAFEVPVEVNRNAAGFAPFALSNGVARSVTLPAGSTHDKLYFDVPPNATSVTFTTSGTGSVRLDASHLASPSFPGIQSAPGTNNATSNLAGANQSITLTGGNLLPGRWYLKPTNTGGGATQVNVTATINTATTVPEFKPGSYFNPGRSGHGLFIYRVAGIWFGLWYTYNQDGTPTWYTMEAPAPTGRVWSSPINRVSYNPTATAALEVPVGNAVLTMTSENTFQFSYNLDGETGSEPMSAFVTGCPIVNSQNLDVSAAWYNPASPGFGYSVQVNPNFEFIATFVYDGFGQPRFLLAEREGTFNAANPTIPLSQLTGFCPLCTRTGDPVFTTVGTLTRTYATNDLVDVGVTATFINGVPGSWSRSTTVDILGNPQGCTP